MMKIIHLLRSEQSLGGIIYSPSHVKERNCASDAGEGRAKEEENKTTEYE